MNALEPKVRELLRHLPRSAGGAGGFDFIADLGAQMPMRTIGMLFGIPEEDQVALRQHIDASLRLEEGEMPDVAEQFSAWYRRGQRVRRVHRLA